MCNTQVQVSNIVGTELLIKTDKYHPIYNNKCIGDYEYYLFTNQIGMIMISSYKGHTTWS